VSTYGVSVVITGLIVRYYRINLRLRRLMRQQQPDITNDISLDGGYELLGRKLDVFGQPLVKRTKVFCQTILLHQSGSDFWRLWIRRLHHHYRRKTFCWLL
jgi:hypothetical protein